ncbi:hypothetical protein KI688_010847 [Linnemannia hyalina]|uniref:DUF1748-domain-containing protein n=1 Tax=Linnemannia hyalina TaxID=64524 RepID=A0A9P7XXV2_9FUNG|nr:hypothetical protein KI688_010847 [Linnemannia hyalina]
MLGKLVHYAADAILISAVLAGIKRSTGLTVASNKIESKDVRSALDQYLGIGEWVVDQGIMFMSNSKYFYRKSMDSDDQHDNYNSDLNELQSTQERRRLLEAYQAEQGGFAEWWRKSTATSPKHQEYYTALQRPFKNQQTCQYSFRTDTFGTKSIRQDRATIVSSAKKQEEIYLSQARLMQWYLMTKRADEHFSAQEKSAEAQFELVGRSLLEKQTKLQDLQKRFEVEQNLVKLESTLGCQRDQLLSIIDGLDTFKADYEEFTAALDREARVLSIPGIDDSNLNQWLGQIKDCQSVLELSSRRSGKDCELVQAIAQVMQELCCTVKEEIQEMRQCAALVAELREAETIEASLLASSLRSN